MEIGEYIRTKDGVISKCEYIDNNECGKFWWFDKTLYEDYGESIDFLHESVINDFLVKHSKNIIDLIELGDLVELFVEYNLDKEDTNLFEVIAIDEKTNEIGVFGNNLELEFFPIDNLISIVTREQFESMKYEVN